MRHKNYISYLLVYVLLIASCTNDMESIHALRNKEELPDIEVDSLHTRYVASSKLKVRLQAGKAYRYLKPDKQYSLFPKGIFLEFFDSETGNIHATLKANRAIYYDKKGYAKASGSVILTNVNGSKLQTEELFVDEKEEKIYSIKRVQINDEDGFEIVGEGGFESNLDFTVYKFTDVSGKKILEEGDNFFPGNEEED